jgi:hypothetical protein
LFGTPENWWTYFLDGKSGLKRVAHGCPQSVHLRNDCGHDTELPAAPSRLSGFILWQGEI